MSYRKYDSWMQDLLRSIVAYKLSEISQVPSDKKQESIYLTFKTKYPNVVLPENILRDYPESMTIVLDNNYWDLIVGVRQFEIGISIQGTPIKIVIPYLALMSFVDTKELPIFSITFDQSVPSNIETHGVWQPAGRQNYAGADQISDFTSQTQANNDFCGLTIKEKFLPQYLQDEFKKTQEITATNKNNKNPVTARILPFSL